MSLWNGLACVGAGLAGAAMAAISAYGLIEADRIAERPPPAAARFAGAVAGALVEAPADSAARALCVLQSALEPGALSLRGAGADSRAVWLVGPADPRPPSRAPAPGLHAVEALRLDRPLELGAACAGQVRAAIARGSVVCLVESVLLDPESRAAVAVRFHGVALGAERRPVECPLTRVSSLVWPLAEAPPPLAAISRGR